MPILNINPSEMLYGIRNGHANQAGLSGISIGANDVIVEFLIKNYAQDIAEGKKSGNWVPTYFQLYNNAGTHYIIVARFVTLIRTYMVDAGGAIYIYDVTDGIFKNVLHIFIVFRNTSVITMINGHSLHTQGKVAHNIDSSHLVLPSTPCPSILCLCRLYAGGLSGFSDADLLAIHRKYLRHPMINPTELAPYLRFCWRGRNADGSQPLAGQTWIENEVNSEHLNIAGGLNFGNIRAPVWQPR